LPPAQRNVNTTSWEKVTGTLRLDEHVNDALFEHGPEFGATWNSRAEMLRACLDEYYRVISNLNDTQRLLEISEADLEPLRRDQAVATARVREAEARIEFQSRLELRAVYLGAAEVEARLFRAEQEHNLLSNRLELLNGFLVFLSRIIATVRAMPKDTLLSDLGAVAGDPLTGGADAQDVALQETITYEEARARLAATQAVQPTTQPITRQVAGNTGGAGDEDVEELIIDERDMPLLASGEFEIVEIVDETQAAEQALRPAPMTKKIASSPANAANADESRDPTQKSE
jgi:hypothetical protein